MPLDDTAGFLAPARTHPREKEIAICDEMERLLARPSSWCKDRYMVGSSMCLIGSVHIAERRLNFVGEIDGDEVIRRISKEIETLTGILQCLGDYNDAPTTTHTHILALIRRTRASFEAECA